MTEKEKTIANYMKKLQLTKEEAEELWLTDNGYEVNEEQEELDKTAKGLKIDTGIDKTKKPRKPREIKVSDEKAQLFEEIRGFLTDNYNNVKVLKENKLIWVQIGEKILELDLREKRPPKV